ncbi:MAG TPA: alpha/beta hydrolase [Pyrinomonadaceae bacterium]
MSKKPLELQRQLTIHPTGLDRRLLFIILRCDSWMAYARQLIRALDCFHHNVNISDKSMKVTATVFLLLVSVIAVGQQKDKKTTHPPPGKLVDVGGYRLHLNCTGKNGPTVVLIAGAGDFSFDWGLMQPEVSRFTRVCSYDRAGLAWSDPGPTPRTMRQDAYELHTLLKTARVQAPYVLVGHSIGGLIARVYAEQYPAEVAGMVLVDSTHEDTTLMYQGKLVRVREGAKGVAVPPVQTMQSSPPKPAAAEDIEQFEFNQKMFGAPKTEPPFDKLPASIQAMRLWFRSQPPRAAAGPDFWAEELQAMYTARAKSPHQLGDKPLVVLLAKPVGDNLPPGISPDDWKQINEEKRRQKVEIANLSRNSKLIVAERSGHHIQLDEPQVVTDAIRVVVGAVRRRSRLAP